MILESLQRARRNTSVLMLKLKSSWLGLSIKMVQKCVKIFMVYGQLDIYAIKPR